MGLIGGMARTAVVAGTATAVSNRVSRRQGNRWAEKDQAAAYNAQYAQPQYAQPQYVQPQNAPPPQQYAPPPAAPAAPAAPDMTDQLRALAELKAQGILSEEEFTAAKAKILSS